MSTAAAADSSLRFRRYRRSGSRSLLLSWRSGAARSCGCRQGGGPVNGIGSATFSAAAATTTTNAGVNDDHHERGRHEYDNDDDDNNHQQYHDVRAKGGPLCRRCFSNFTGRKSRRYDAAAAECCVDPAGTVATSSWCPTAAGITAAARFFIINDITAARAIHDHAIESPESTGIHKRRWCKTRGIVANTRAFAAHAIGSIARLQHARGYNRDLRRLLVDRQRIFFRSSSKIVQFDIKFLSYRQITHRRRDVRARVQRRFRLLGSRRALSGELLSAQVSSAQGTRARGDAQRSGIVETKGRGRIWRWKMRPISKVSLGSSRKTNHVDSGEGKSDRFYYHLSLLDVSLLWSITFFFFFGSLDVIVVYFFLLLSYIFDNRLRSDSILWSNKE